EPVTIASIDFVKQPEVLRGLALAPFDLLVVDEAHQVASAAQRSEAVSLLASRARFVVLLTATPHTGDEAAYRTLCAIGALGEEDPLAFFHRTRIDAGMDRERRVHMLAVTPTSEELEMHALVSDYARRLWAAGEREDGTSLRLLSMILAKRAFSSAAS